MAEKKVVNKEKGKEQESSIKEVKTVPVLKVNETFSRSDKEKKKEGT